MYCDTNEMEYRYDYSCINLRTFRSDRAGHLVWLDYHTLSKLGEGMRDEKRDVRRGTEY
jgi:hypothetical protein